MRYFKGYCLLLISILLLTGCTYVEKSPSNTKLTIESYSLSENESLLISKTGVEQIEFFKLNGTLKEEDDLQFSVEVFENGKFKEELLKTWDEVQTIYEDSVISFGISDRRVEDQSLELLNGIPSGLATTFYPNNMTASTFSKLIEGEITLEKNKPIYLAAWLGTTKNELRSGGGGDGELPAGIKDAELAFIYKVLWIDK
ncbi:hypothetical protein M3649_08180 [Ureibacillus chungkukjangi]|uniref:hypothetical protein n=1 Tax=Ureibacillus chungkukjangi TaxID=1202712 RepID=UPI00203AD68F|nr:hypothetical protein [Ureibacillus chungkukjangi]MCM3388111.1 hypothetical protein [Ureibacillus chungkukjangi]